ncbi:CBS domain-containing protein [Streptomyces sp. PA03-6a]|nr:CBS domain-containing protein [Streptomyces sp. PA03-6a]
MKVSEFMNAPVVTVQPGTPARQAALRMEDAGVGSVLVARADRLLGIVTDRDLVVRCLAQGGDPDMPVSELMSAPVTTLDVTDDLADAYRTFRRCGVPCPCWTGTGSQGCSPSTISSSTSSSTWPISWDPWPGRY